jgi:hypothetical protein
MATPLLSLSSTAAKLARGESIVASRTAIAEVNTVMQAMEAASAERLRIEAANVRLLDETTKQAERLRILHEIDRALIADQAPVAIAEAVVRPLRELLGVPRVIVNLFDFAAGEVEWLAAAGRRRIRLGAGVRYSMELAGDGWSSSNSTRASPRSTRARAWGWPSPSVSSSGRAARSGRGAPRGGEVSSLPCCPVSPLGARG